ncbi:MAG: Holliday junction branch migration protein RuvA [Lachnospiraceae bacterium]|nr:Holliday junction branch migration protein RuvA [Lachnospiraceae bacterium]
MIAYLIGTVAAVTEKKVVLDVNHVGFQLSVSDRDIQNMPQVGEEVKMYTYMSVREDAISLFGFLRKDELELYRMMINVSGIGPKGGLNILSVLSADAVRLAVLSDDAKAIAKAPGIGNKTAQKLILELKDKMKLEDVLEDIAGDDDRVTDNELEAVRSEAAQALSALGYSSSDALYAVRKVKVTGGMTAEDVLKMALRVLL